VKIWYQSTINFDHQPNYRAALAAHFERVASPGTEVLLHGRAAGFGRDLMVTDLISSPIAYHMVVPQMYIRALLTAQKSGADAFVIGSFSEPILPELRSLATIPVVSLSEATMLAACMVAPRMGFLALNTTGVPYLDKSIALHKMAARVSGIHVVDGDFPEQALEAMFAKPTSFLGGLMKSVRTAIAHGAQVVVPGEGVLAVMASGNGVREVDGVPIIDSIGTPVLVAELAVNIKKRTGVAQSRAAYPAPSAETMRVIIGS
jgi:allantoin racemase